VTVPRSAIRTLAVLAVLGLARGAAAETLNCTPITALPFTITAKGIYCLTGDLNTSINTGNALEIAASNVVLDLNGHKIAGLSAGPSSLAAGVSVNQRQNVTIKNGTVRGFFVGIAFYDASPSVSQGNVIEDMRLDHNLFQGIYLIGHGCTVRSNQVLFTGGSTTLGANVPATAIYVGGSSNRVLDNDVVSVLKQGTGVAYGIRITMGIDTLVVENRITRADYALFFDNGADGKYQGNLTNTVAVTAYTGGFDAGSNN
jgi:hypothetical protein